MALDSETPPRGYKQNILKGELAYAQITEAQKLSREMVEANPKLMGE